MSTKIQWTDESSNPLKARRVSDGKPGYFCRMVDDSCLHCYASELNRKCGCNPARHGTGHVFKLSESKYLEPWLNHDELGKIERRRVSRRIFVCDMTDVCASIYECPTCGKAKEAEDSAARGMPSLYCLDCGDSALLKWWPSEMIQKCFDAWAIAAHNGMTIQMLTKRPLRLGAELERWAAALRPGFGIPGTDGMTDEQITAAAMPERWYIGTSLGNRAGIHRIEQLRAIPAYLRFLSLEPLIEDLGEIDLTGIGWVILSGEYGASARVCDVRWIDSLVDQCRSAGVSVFVNQLGTCVREFGELRPGLLSGVPLRDKKGRDPSEWPGGLERFPREVPA